MKIASNSALSRKKAGWIDFNAGQSIEGVPMDQLSKTFFDYVLRVASGERTVGEQHGMRDLAIFKDGVTL